LKRHVAVALLVSIGITTSAPSVARADEKAAAQALLDEGNQLLGDGEYVPALERFRAAYAKFPSNKLLLNIGTTLRQLGRNAEAATTYEQYLRDPTADPKKADEARRILREIEALVGYVRVRVVAPSQDAAIDVTLDGHGLSVEVPVRVDPGEHTVIVTTKGYPSAAKTLSIGAGRSEVVELSFSRPNVVVRADRGATQRTVGWVAGGAGVAGLGVGVALAVLAKSKDSDANLHCLTPSACDAEGVSLGNAARSLATGSTVAFIAGGVAVATGLVLLISAPSKPSTNRARVTLDGALVRF
jgi:hypothetical protein